ncbi:MAG: MCE family protein [Deltaproteobacteria bacterium]|nr:MCE family protein [Deltaproteobacteria bacterium]MBI3295216.1 MCE family protein [Deltaproteobacteria bacterium]
MDRKVYNNIILGIVICIASLAFVYVVFNIGGGRGIFRSEVTVLAKFSHVKGLHFGSEVSLAGLRIGVIRKIRVATDDSKDLTVELSIMKNYRDRIRKDSVATIKTQGVLGDKYIEISIGSPSSPLLQEGQWIATNEPADLFTKSGNLVEDIAKQFDKGGEVDSLLRNLNHLVVNLNTLTNDLNTRKPGEKLASALNHTDAILKKIHDGDGTLGALVNDPSVYEDLKHMLGGAKRSTVLKYFMRQFMESGSEKENKK